MAKAIAAVIAITITEGMLSINKHICRIWRHWLKLELRANILTTAAGTWGAS
jgi:hypothetical protein